MILLVSGATTSVAWFHPKRVGVLCVPGSWSHHIHENRPWAGDNGAYSGFEEWAFLAMLEKLQPYRSTCLFISAPDVVGNAEQTADLFKVWAPRIREAGYPVAYVLQDGATTLPPCDAVFLGGTTLFKLSEGALRLCDEAKATGRWVHVGRVNTSRRIQRFIEVADSIDGGTASRWAMTNIPKMLRWIDQARSSSGLASTWQPSLSLTSDSDAGPILAASSSEES